MPWNRYTDLLPRPLGNLGAQLVSDRRINRSIFLLFFLILSWSGLHFPWKSRPLRLPQNREILAILVRLRIAFTTTSISYRDLRQENDVSSARDACIERQPSHLVPHDLHDEDSAMRRRRRMNTVDGIGRYINRTMKSKRKIATPGSLSMVFGRETILSPSSRSRFAVLRLPLPPKMTRHSSFNLVIGVFHRFHFIRTVLVRRPHQLEGCLEVPRIVPPRVRIPEKSDCFIIR